MNREITSVKEGSILLEFYKKIRQLMPKGSKPNGFPIMIGREKFKVLILNPQPILTRDTQKEYVEVKLFHRTKRDVSKIFHLYPRGMVCEYSSQNMRIEKLSADEIVLAIVLQIKTLDYKTTT